MTNRAQDATAASNESAAAHAQLSDSEMERLCAEAIGIMQVKPRYWRTFRPLHDDAQAMELVKRMNLSVINGATGEWGISIGPVLSPTVWDRNLNRAIVECVAKMRMA